MALLFGFISLFCTLLIFLVYDVGPDVTENFFPEAEFLKPDHLGDLHLVSWFFALQFRAPAKVNIDFKTERVVLVIAQTESVVAHEVLVGPPTVAMENLVIFFVPMLV